MKQNSFGCIEVPLMLYKGVLSRSFCCMQARIQDFEMGGEFL